MSTAPAERNWTPPQRAAIEHVAGDLLVSAAAGSGKTAVLAERCARLVCENIEGGGGCGIDGLLVLTFTEAAANEMRARIANAIRDKIKQSGRRSEDRSRWLQRQAAMVDRASISTLHSFCARVLREHFHEAQIDPAFELIDEDEARLMREEVLDEVLARWHQLPAGEQANHFADFFEAYAQGRDSTCREMILRVYTMLASTADPNTYLRDARTLYTPDGCTQTFDRFVRQVLVGQLRLLALSATRAADDARRHAGPDAPITLGLQQVANLIDRAQRQLAERGADAFIEIREILVNPWPPQLKTMKDVPDFDKLKRRTWQKIKEKLTAFCDETLGNDPAQMQRDLATLAAPLEILLALVDDFSHAFTATKRAQNRLDFSDLERLTLNLLTANGSLAAMELRQRYHHLLVDEFQDINPLQAALLEAVRSSDRFNGNGNLFIVGDVKQSIYGFRLANPQLFLARERAALESSTTKRHIALPHNFRSQPKLLAVMNGLFEKILTPGVAEISYPNGHALEPPPTPAPKPTPDPTLKPFDGAPVELHLVAMDQEEDEEEQSNSHDAAAFPSENLSAVEEEARMVAARIESLMLESRAITQKDGTTRKLAYRDIAILLRSMKNKAMIFARALAQRGIPVHADLSTGYFDTAEVRDTLALLQILDNPQQDIPLATVLLGPYGRFSHDDLALIRLTYDRKTVPFAAAVHRYPADGETPTDPSPNPPPHDSSLAQRLQTFLEKITAWRDLLRTRPLHDGLAQIYADSKILPYLAGLDAGEQRIANLQALHQRALRFAGFSKQGLHRFLRFIEKLRDQEGDFGEAPVLSEASNVVRIMSVHKSKGLEFPVVIAAGMGSLLNLRTTGPIFVHRNLGIGLHVADVDRNIFYPSASSATITDANERSSRAEELRLLYVALTRARDHLLLTGHIDKAEKLQTKRTEWNNHTGPLPEDILLKGRTFLDWILPSLASSPLHIRWPDVPPLENTQIEITIHPPQRAAITSPESDQSNQTELAHRLIEGDHLPSPPPPTTEITQLITRVTGIYAHADLAKQPAVRTVSELKTQSPDDSDSPTAQLLPRIAKTPASQSEDPRLRGIATHRLLELLDFTHCDTPEELTTQLQSLTTTNRLLPEDAARVDIDAILWLLTTPVAKRIIHAAKQIAAGNKSLHIRREIPFTWTSPIPTATPSTDPADWPTIRGTIDLLLIDSAKKTAEILDYKTDSPFTWQSNLPDYQRQMNYYFRAATDILNFPATRATLLFLSAKQSVEVTT